MNTLLRRRIMMNVDGRENDTMKEWKLLKEIDFSQSGWDAPIKIDECTELYVEARGIINISTTSDTSLNIMINGTTIGQVDAKKTSDTENASFFQKGYMKYNGLFWKYERTAGCLNENAQYQSQWTAMMVPFIYPKDIGSATEILLKAPSSAYNPKSGTLKIYGR